MARTSSLMTPLPMATASSLPSPCRGDMRTGGPHYRAMPSTNLRVVMYVCVCVCYHVYGNGWDSRTDRGFYHGWNVQLISQRMEY